MFRGSSIKRHCTRVEFPEVFIIQCELCAIEVYAGDLRVLATITQRVLGADTCYHWLCLDCPGDCIDSDDDSAAETQLDLDSD